jgi:hypothetical protein
VSGKEQVSELDCWDIDDLTLRTSRGTPEWVEATSVMVLLVFVLSLVGGHSELYRYKWGGDQLTS